MPSRSATTLVAVAVLALAGLVAPGPSQAVSTDHGNQVVSPMPTRGTPHAMDGSVDDIVQVGNTIVAAGTFTRVSPADTFTDTSDDLVRNRIFAFDATTGEIDPNFNPNLGNGEATSLATDGTYVYVGGKFGSVGGKTAYKRLVKLNMSGLPVTEFKVKPSSFVNDLVLRGNRLYVGGQFTSMKSRAVTYPRNALAAVDPVRGTPLDSVVVPFNGVYDPNKRNPGKTNIKKFDVTADGSRLIAIGNFSSVAGQPRAQIAMLNTSSATTTTLAPWFTNRFERARNSCAGVFDTFTRNVDFSPDGSYFVVTTTGAFAGGANSGTMCDSASRWETNSTGNDPTWINYTGGDTLYGVAVTGGVVYIGGHPRYFNNPFQGDQAGPGAVPREGIAALDPLNGMPLTWNPGRDRGVGAQALFATDDGLWVGSDTTIFNSQRRGRVAFLPLADGTQLPATPAQATLPNNLFGASVTSGGGLVRRGVDGSGAPTGPGSVVNTALDWSTVRGAFLLGGTLYHGMSNNTLYRRTFDPATGAVGPATAVNLYDDPDNGNRIPFAISSMTGMFFDHATHRIYYTVSGDSRLFYRYFTPESEIVGAQTFTADNGGVSFASAAGLTMAGGRILYGSTDGTLRSVPFSSGRVTGGPTVLSNDGTWRFRALFVATS